MGFSDKLLAHSLYECKYHVVFCPKYRYRILKDEVVSFVEQEIYRLCSQKDGVEVIELNVQMDHVHLVLWIPLKYAVQCDGFSERKDSHSESLSGFRMWDVSIGGDTFGRGDTASAPWELMKDGFASM